MIRQFSLACALLAAGAGSAVAECKATVTGSVAALEDSSSTLEAGDDFGRPTQLQIIPKDQSSSICAEGGYCYPSGSIVLDGCRIVADPDPTASGDPEEPIIFMLRQN